MQVMGLRGFEGLPVRDLGKGLSCHLEIAVSFVEDHQVRPRVIHSRIEFKGLLEEPISLLIFSL